MWYVVGQGQLPLAPAIYVSVVVFEGQLPLAPAIYMLSVVVFEGQLPLAPAIYVKCCCIRESTSAGTCYIILLMCVTVVI